MTISCPDCDYTARPTLRQCQLLLNNKPSYGTAEAGAFSNAGCSGTFGMSLRDCTSNSRKLGHYINLSVWHIVHVLCQYFGGTSNLAKWGSTWQSWNAVRLAWSTASMFSLTESIVVMKCWTVSATMNMALGPSEDLQT